MTVRLKNSGFRYRRQAVICWRMSRRWYVPVLLIAIVFGEIVLQDARNPEGAAVGVSLLMVLLAGLATLSAMSLSNKEGFPFRYQYRQPVSTFCWLLCQCS